MTLIKTGTRHGLKWQTEMHSPCLECMTHKQLASVLRRVAELRSALTCEHPEAGAPVCWLS